MSEQQAEQQDASQEPKKALGTGAKPAVDGDMAKARPAEDVSPEANLPGVTAPEVPDTDGSQTPIAPVATPVSGNTSKKGTPTNG